MISLKQFLDQRETRKDHAETREDQQETLIDAASVPVQDTREPHKEPPDEWKTAWRSLILAVADSAGRAIPPLGPALCRELTTLERKADTERDARTVVAVGESVREELARWSSEASRFYGQHQEELKEIIAVVARTAESIGHRDEDYTGQLGMLAAKLRAVADETDLSVIRRSIIESAGAVQSCVARMAEAGLDALRHLAAQTEEYRRRLEEAERNSLLDPLTGVLNRRGLNRELERKIADGKPFLVTLLDLDEFKKINDSYGHAAGDDLLRQLGAELASQFTAPRTAARMGGDEFVVIAPGPPSEAGAVAEKIRSWILGKYRISDGNNNRIEVRIQGAIGSASWNGKETAEMLLARADGLMYRTKAAQGSNVVRSQNRAETQLAGVIRS